MEYVYHCKKNGKDYTYRTAVEFAAPQDAYAWRRGVREYADNYHASVGKPGTTAANAMVIGDGDNARPATMDEFTAHVDALCIEARDKFHTGDVPAERGPTDPKQTEMRKVVAALLSQGWSADQVVEALSKKKKAA